MDVSYLNCERARIEFLLNRDGLEEAIDFAERTKVCYRRHVLTKCPRELKRLFIQSYLEFKEFLRRNSQ